LADGAQSIGRIAERFPGAIVRQGEFRDQHWAELAGESVIEVARWLREDPDAAFDLLVDVTAMHWPDEPRPIEIVWHLFSTSRNDRLRLKARFAAGQPAPSLTGIWKSADWNERETYDMFGIRFAGHGDLRRILMPDDYTDFPLLKQFPLFRG
jgi:NADH/F420H2 dehydrogenase subunit C